MSYLGLLLANPEFWGQPYSFTLATGDGRALVAVGCAEGVWIGFRHDSRCELYSSAVLYVAQRLSAAMRRVLHLKMVTQCAMLEDFGIFLVLADKVKAPLCFLNLKMIISYFFF